jgi:hypothetical protein
MLKYFLIGAFLVTLAYGSAIPTERSDDSKVMAGPVCELCTLVLTAAQHQLQNNKTEEEIDFIERQLCGKLGPMNSTCCQYMDTNGRQILDQLSKKVDPAVICKDIGLCSTQKPSINAPYLPMVDNSLNCTLCKMVFTQVQNMLKNNQSEQQILNFIENKLCNATGKLAPECKMLIDAFGPYILTYVANGTDPEKLCEMIGMCSATWHPTKPQGHKPPFTLNVDNVGLAVNPIYCTLCEYSVQFIDMEIKKNQTEEAIVHALDMTCKVVPEALKKECDSLINTYGIYLVQLLIELADPLKVCSAIKLC